MNGGFGANLNQASRLRGGVHGGNVGRGFIGGTPGGPATASSSADILGGNGNLPVGPGGQLSNVGGSGLSRGGLAPGSFGGGNSGRPSPSSGFTGGVGTGFSSQPGVGSTSPGIGVGLSGPSGVSNGAVAQSAGLNGAIGGGAGSGYSGGNSGNGVVGGTTSGYGGNFGGSPGVGATGVGAPGTGPGAGANGNFVPGSNTQMANRGGNGPLSGLPQPTPAGPANNQATSTTKRRKKKKHTYRRQIVIECSGGECHRVQR